jgi:hypothetical protein
VTDNLYQDGSFQSYAYNAFKSLLRKVQPEIEELQTNKLTVFQWKGEQVGLYNTYENTVQLIIFSRDSLRKETGFEYLFGEDINWKQIELRVKISVRQLIEKE